MQVIICLPFNSDSLKDQNRHWWSATIPQEIIHPPSSTPPSIPPSFVSHRFLLHHNPNEYSGVRKPVSSPPWENAVGSRLPNDGGDGAFSWPAPPSCPRWAPTSPHHVIAFLAWVMWSVVGRDKDACVSPNHAQSGEFRPVGIQSRCKNNERDWGETPHGYGSGVTTKAPNTKVNGRLPSLKENT